jgi:poly[(R)-3-hydroxyalkanoate] polymerase subunit PhaC
MAQAALEHKRERGTGRIISVSSVIGGTGRMPAAMHSFYLRSLYLRNEPAMGDLELAGQRLSLREITCDSYVVGAVNDHIVPWQASFQAARLLGGHVRYVLTSGGHVAGIVNPPSPKAWYLTGPEDAPNAAGWRAAAAREDDSWWAHWADWAGARAGERVAPPAMGSRHHPPLADAPGSYVLG